MLRRDPAQALTWIARLLTSRGIPFQAVGGLAARAYGASRELVDLDFYISMRRYSEIEAEVAPYLTRAPTRHQDETWDLTFAQLVYAGQKIELGAVEGARFFDRSAGEWVEQQIDFSRSRWLEVLGVVVPVMPKEELIAYKRKLDREVDRLDLAEIA